jgi:hypothetical protein
MTWRWIAPRQDRPASADAAVQVREPDGHPAGFLAVWPQGAKRPRQGRRIDARAIDLSGEAAWVSLVWAPDGVWLDFDDPAVVEATREVLAQPWSAAVLSTLMVEEMRFGGAVTAVRDDPRRLADDPFARLFPARILWVDAGLLGTMPAPVGPGTQRYGAGNPWPWDRFGSGSGR